MQGTHGALGLHPAALLGDAQQVEGLASLQVGAFVEFLQGDGRGTGHEGLGGVDSTPEALDEGRDEAGRDAEDAEEEEDADGAMVGAEAMEKHLLGYEAELEIVRGELLDGLDDLGQGGQRIPVVGAFDGLVGRGGLRQADDGCVEDLTAHLGRVALGSFLGSASRVAVITIQVRQATDGKDAGGR